MPVGPVADAELMPKSTPSPTKSTAKATEMRFSAPTIKSPTVP